MTNGVVAPTSRRWMEAAPDPQALDGGKGSCVGSGDDLRHLLGHGVQRGILWQINQCLDLG